MNKEELKKIVTKYDNKSFDQEVHKEYSNELWKIINNIDIKQLNNLELNIYFVAFFTKIIELICLKILVINPVKLEIIFQEQQSNNKIWIKETDVITQALDDGVIYLYQHDFIQKISDFRNNYSLSHPFNYGAEKLLSYKEQSAVFFNNIKNKNINFIADKKNIRQWMKLLNEELPFTKESTITFFNLLFDGEKDILQKWLNTTNNISYKNSWEYAFENYIDIPTHIEKIEKFIFDILLNISKKVKDSKQWFFLKSIKLIKLFINNETIKNKESFMIFFNNIFLKFVHIVFPFYEKYDLYLMNNFLKENELFKFCFREDTHDFYNSFYFFLINNLVDKIAFNIYKFEWIIIKSNGGIGFFENYYKIYQNCKQTRKTRYDQFPEQLKRIIDNE